MPTERTGHRLFSRWEAAASGATAAPVAGALLPRDKYDKGHLLRWGGLYLTCWLPYLFIRFPGNMDPDTAWQLMETYGLALASDHHPWFDTLVFGAFWRLGDAAANHLVSLLTFSLVQMALTALVFALVTFYLERIGAPRWFIRLSKVFFALYPALPLFAMTMMKESLFGWIWVLGLLLIVEVVRTRGAALRNAPFSLLFALSLCLIMLTKKSGFEILIITAIPLAFYCSQDRKRTIGFFVGSFLFYAVIWSSLLLPLWGVASGEGREMLSLPAQMAANVVHEHDETVTEQEWAVLEGVFDDAHSLGERYMPTRADAVKDLLRADATSAQMADFCKLAASWLVKYPGSCAEAFAAQNAAIFSPWFDTSSYENYVFYLDNIPAASAVEADPQTNTLVTSAVFDSHLTDAAPIEALLQGIYRSDLSASLSATLTGAYHALATFAWPFFNDALFAFWIPLLILVVALRKRRLDVIVALVPTLACTLSILFGPVVIPRYLIPLVYTTPLTAGLLFLPDPQNSAADGGKDAEDKKEPASA